MKKILIFLILILVLISTSSANFSFYKRNYESEHSIKFMTSDTYKFKITSPTMNYSNATIIINMSYIQNMTINGDKLIINTR